MACLPEAGLSEASAGGAALFQNFFGTLDAQGNASATLWMPNLTVLQGLTFYIAFASVHPAAPFGIRTITRPLRVVVQ